MAFVDCGATCDHPADAFVMIDPDLLRRCGVIIESGFLDPDECRHLTALMAGRHHSTPALLHDHGEEAVVEQIRRTRIVHLPRAAGAGLEQRLDEWKQRLAEHFDTALGECQTPQFLSYTQGDYFRAHVDAARSERSTASIVQRRVSVVVFLNTQDNPSDAGDYSGGDLVLYGLLPGEQWGKYGAAVPSAPGTLVAFPSHMRHEVTEVTRGTRATVVSWYLSPAA